MFYSLCARISRSEYYFDESDDVSVSQFSGRGPSINFPEIIKVRI